MDPALQLFFWLQVAVFALHILDETTCRGRFVERVRKSFAPGITWTKFWVGNLTFLAILAASAWAYGRRGGHWVILPLVWFVERPGNTVWHVWWSVKFNEYSPGLATSLLFPFNLLLVLYYGAYSGHIARLDLGVALALGALAWTIFSSAPPLLARFFPRGPAAA